MTLRITPVEAVQVTATEWGVYVDGVPYPGLYTDVDAALTALSLEPEILERLWERRRPCPMTRAMLIEGEC